MKIKKSVINNSKFAKVATNKKKTLSETAVKYFSWRSKEVMWGQNQNPFFYAFLGVEKKTTVEEVF